MIKKRYFIGVEITGAFENWPLAFSSGNSTKDGQDWSITTYYLKGDEVPPACCDAMDFAQLQAGLLNAFYNRVDVSGLDEDAVMALGKCPPRDSVPHPENPELPF